MDWELLEYVGETLVFIGVVGEVFAEWREPERRKLAKASSIVLVIGLALSLAALKGTNEQFARIIAGLKLQTSQANERAAKNESIADGLKKDNLRLGLDLGKQEQQTAEARTEAARAQIELSKLKAPRELTEAQQRKLVKELKSFSGTPITIEFEFSDGEAKALEMQLWSVLNRAGWKVIPNGISSHAASTLGIVVASFGEMTTNGVPIPHRFAAAAEVLSKSLANIGLLSKYPGVVEVSTNPNDSVQMIVGRKP